MYFDDEDDDDQFLDHELLLDAIEQEFYGAETFIEHEPEGNPIPTHTEDGIPIRKIYVSNLPPKTSRSELFGVFTQYGFIKSCWLRMGERGPNRTPSPTYAFVTYYDPVDAYRALKAPIYEKVIRGRHLRIFPADSWHQPLDEDCQPGPGGGGGGGARGGGGGGGGWPRRVHAPDCGAAVPDAEIGPVEAVAVAEPAAESAPAPAPPEPEPPVEPVSDPSPEPDSPEDADHSVLSILNLDCWAGVLAHVPFVDLVRSERVSKGWRTMLAEYYRRVRVFKTSCWQHNSATLTTAVLRRLFRRVGPALARVHIDHHWSALNDRTPHTIGKFCPNLEELKVVGMYTKNWNPVFYGCKKLKSISFISCNKLTDSSLVHLVRCEPGAESLTVANNSHVTGLFLTGSRPRLAALAFYNCYNLQGSVLCAAADSLAALTTLKLDQGPVSLWRLVPSILKKLPNLEVLSLSEYTSVENVHTENEELCEALATLKNVKSLNVSRNLYMSNEMLKIIAKTCSNLEHLNVACCNARRRRNAVTNRIDSDGGGVSDAGLAAVARLCPALRSVDVSYLSGVRDAGAGALAASARLRSLVARGNSQLSAAPFEKCLQGCPLLEELDVCGCAQVSERLVEAARAELARRPRPLLLRLAGTAAADAAAAAGEQDATPLPPLLSVNYTDDLTVAHLRPEFNDRLLDAAGDDDGDYYGDGSDDDDHLLPDDVDMDLHMFAGLNMLPINWRLNLDRRVLL